MYLFISREKEKEGKKEERNIDVNKKKIDGSSTHPFQEPNLQPTRVPCLGIQLATFCFEG